MGGRWDNRNSTRRTSVIRSTSNSSGGAIGNERGRARHGVVAEDVAGGIPNVEEEARGVDIDVSGDADSAWASAAGGSLDSNLDASDVELRLAALLDAVHDFRRVRDRAGVIERQHLCAHQIVACFNICWDNTRLWEVVQAQTIRTEHAVHKTVLGHLEPAVTGADGGGGVGDFLHVDCTRTLVGVICDTYRDGAVFKGVVGRRDIWICSPFEGNCVAGYEGISGYELK